MNSHLANYFKKSKKRYIKYCCTVYSRVTPELEGKTVKDINW